MGGGGEGVGVCRVCMEGGECKEGEVSVGEGKEEVWGKECECVI